MKRLLALSLFLFPLAVHAQISTDRPGLGTGTSTVGASVVQIEAGVPQVSRNTFESFFFNEPTDSFVSKGEASFTSYSFPVLLRVGVAERIELRASTSLYNAMSVSGDGVDSDSHGEVGFDAVSFGAKFGLTDAAASVQAALVPEVLVSTEDSFDPAAALTLALGHMLANGVALGGTLIGSGTINDLSDTLSGAVIGSVGYPFSSQISGYVEGAYTFNPGDNGAFAGAGILLLVSPQFQLDASFDAGLNEASNDLLFGLGASYRF